MMHKAKIVKVEAVSNGAVAVHVCCGDDELTHASVHTCYVENLTDQQIEAGIKEHLARVESLHAARLRAEEIARKYQGK